MTNHASKYLLDKGVVLFIDDILIYTKNENIYDEFVKEVLERLSMNDLVISPEECIWGEKDVEFRGYILTPYGLMIAKDKTKAI
jgi:hypothetical protein